MSTSVKQALVLAVGGGLLVVAVLVLARRRLMTTRYALGWMTIGVLVAVGALFANAVPEIGRVAGMTPTAVLLAIATIVLLVIAMQLSISVSGLQSQIRDLAEDHALLEDRLHELEPSERL